MNTDLITAGADLATKAPLLIMGQKLFGKTIDVISKDISNLYEKGRDKIIEKATKKVKNLPEYLLFF